jgi:hypothetical protein
VSEVEADQAERGALYGEFIWVDRAQPTGAVDGAVWITIDVPDNRLPKFETRSDSQLGYRQFRLPSRLTNLHPAQRVQPAD